MAQFKDIYLPALDNPEHVWRIGYYKPDRAPGVVSATEGQVCDYDTWQSFTCDLFGCRKYRHQLPGRATKRAIAQGLAALLTEMRDAGVVPPDRAAALITKCAAV